MTRIEMIELFINDWKAVEEQDKALGLEKQEQYAKGRKDGLMSALEIFKRPSNTQMQTDACPIHKYCKHYIKDGCGSEPCGVFEPWPR